eukprot:Phypoly_transcript_10964.p1 GENE.Phypoly_transcript_10964~~Phypoly_transcript_10964.p1  ORF type:complete len:358 (+),score=49.92 Phypoly_transcript_10964:138-1211(+)
MKFFGDSKATRLLEEYHPYASVVALIGIGISKYYHPESFTALTDISYPSTMQRESGEVEHYRKGFNDRLFVFFIFNVITVLRFLHRKLVVVPIAKKLQLSKGTTHKLIDASWFFLFFLVATVWGYVIFRDDEWWYSSPNLWAGYPHPFDYHMKYYYLFSLGFWIQCLVSFFFESPRKDDKAFFFHHLLTIGLIMASYRFNFFRVGAAILMEQNAADILYYQAKMCKYAGSDRAAEVTLVGFVIAWVYTRHFIFGWILYSIWYELPAFLNTPGWDDESGYYYAEWLWVAFISALVALQLLMIYWFFLILRVIYRAVFLGVTADSTDVSDSDDEEEELKNGASRKRKAKATKPEKKKVK